MKDINRKKMNEESVTDSVNLRRNEKESREKCKGPKKDREKSRDSANEKKRDKGKSNKKLKRRNKRRGSWKGRRRNSAKNKEKKKSGKKNVPRKSRNAVKKKLSSNSKETAAEVVRIVREDIAVPPHPAVVVLLRVVKRKKPKR